jgi:predicted ribosome-associated RNA-binding protein Tma20
MSPIARAAALIVTLQLAACLSAAATRPMADAAAGRALQQAKVWIPGIVRVDVDAKGNTNVNL